MRTCVGAAVILVMLLLLLHQEWSHFSCSTRDRGGHREIPTLGEGKDKVSAMHWPAPGPPLKPSGVEHTNIIPGLVQEKIVTSVLNIVGRIKEKQKTNEVKLRQINVAVVVGMGPMQQRITTQHAKCSVFAQPNCQSIPTTKNTQKKT